MANNLISDPPPDYPKLAKFARIQGQVILQAVVSRTGNVVTARVLRGHHLLRGAATHAVRRWRYRPFILNGRPTDVATIVTVDFRLDH
jgi:TonB family protein